MFRYAGDVYAIDDQTQAQFYALSMIVHEIDGSLAPAVQAGAIEFEFAHALYLHPCPLRDIAIWSEGGVWLYRYLELNITERTVYKMSDVQQLAPIDHPLLAEQVARMLARCGREIISN